MVSRSHSMRSHLKNAIVDQFTVMLPLTQYFSRLINHQLIASAWNFKTFVINCCLLNSYCTPPIPIVSYLAAKTSRFSDEERRHERLNSVGFNHGIFFAISLPIAQGLHPVGCKIILKCSEEPLHEHTPIEASRFFSRSHLLASAAQVFRTCEILKVGSSARRTTENYQEAPSFLNKLTAKWNLYRWPCW